MFLADKEPFLESVSVLWEQGRKKDQVKLSSSHGHKFITAQEANDIENLLEFEAASLLPKEEYWVVSFTDNTEAGRCTRVWFRQTFPMHSRPTRRWPV